MEGEEGMMMREMENAGMTSAEQRGFEPMRRLHQSDSFGSKNAEVLKQKTGQIGKEVSKRNRCNQSK